MAHDETGARYLSNSPQASPVAVLAHNTECVVAAMTEGAELDNPASCETQDDRARTARNRRYTDRSADKDRPNLRPRCQPWTCAGNAFIWHYQLDTHLVRPGGPLKPDAIANMALALVLRQPPALVRLALSPWSRDVQRMRSANR